MSAALQQVDGVVAPMKRAGCADRDRAVMPRLPGPDVSRCRPSPTHRWLTCGLELASLARLTGRSIRRRVRCLGHRIFRAAQVGGASKAPATPVEADVAVTIGVRSTLPSRSVQRLAERVRLVSTRPHRFLVDRHRRRIVSGPCTHLPPRPRARGAFVTLCDYRSRRALEPTDPSGSRPQPQPRGSHATTGAAAPAQPPIGRARGERLLAA